MWSDESVFYQIFPMGFCGAPFENDGVLGHRILKVVDWIPHMNKLGVNAVYFSPIFESDSHGYNTRDYQKIDVRLGTTEDFKEVTTKLHEAGIKVVLDGVFNHVGRGFFGFQDVLVNRENSQYKDWFYIHFDGNSNYNDGLWYEGWEGHFDLVKLNLQNPAVCDYLISCVENWIDTYDIDGLRLDVAYSLNHDFVRRLRAFCNWKKDEFFLLGEMLHGDYKTMVNPDMLHSATNYECYKGLYSSCNSLNLFEIVHSLMRQFGSEPWCLYTGKNLVNFVDNHDVTRIASMLQNKAHIPLIHAICITMPGIPCIYYGSEWGIEGYKNNRDEELRPNVETPVFNELTQFISKLIEIKKTSKALNYGAFRSVVLTNKQCIFERKTDEQRILIAVNIDDNAFDAHFDAGCGMANELITDTKHDFGGGSTLPPMSVQIWEMER